MFAAFILDRDPLRLADLPTGILLWLQAAGGFAAVGLILWLLFGLPRMRKQDRDAVPGWFRVVFLGSCAISAVAYIAFFIASSAGGTGETSPSPILGGSQLTSPTTVAGRLHSIAGGFAVLAAGLPFFLGLARLRIRRILALARLSFKEALRRRVLYAFTGMLFIFLFGSWFVDSKPQDQLRTYVWIVFVAMSLLLLFAAAILSSFSIPADIKQQTIHTIVTKPVERFEIVLGRFLGFLTLMTLVLLLMTALSLLYVLGGIHPEAAAQSLKAREPLYGDLRFENTTDEKKGINVGREWEYRSYISKPNPGKEPETACWDFASVPTSLGKQDSVRCEYGFDIYRTTKGEEGRDVSCTFRFYTWRFLKGNDEAFRKERGALGTRTPKRDSDLAEKYGYFEINAQPVTDYHIQNFDLPGGLFRNAEAADPLRDETLRARHERKIPLTIRVLCDSPTQYVGMAQHDIYVRLDAGQSERALFALNFFKGAFGLWLRLALVIGLAVVLSTYLNGVISLLVTGLLYVGGLSRDFIQSVALGKNEGGGPTEAMVRILQRQLTGVRSGDSASIGDQLIDKSDMSFRLLVHRILNLIPDVDRFDFTDYVAEGFNISGTQMGLDLLLLAAYLLPWAVLAFYLLRWREVASST